MHDRIETKHNLVVIWEHEWMDMLKTDPHVKEFVSKLDIQTRIDPRESFFGGRTNAIKLNHKVVEDEKIRYIDVVSLYPSSQYYGEYPVGHPTIIVNNFKDPSEYFGLLKIKILPPKKLYLPVLPYKNKSGKLTFPLCKTCADTEHQDQCMCTDDQRCLVGVWTSLEVAAARLNGYEIKTIYEVHQFEETIKFDPENGQDGLFNSYIACFLKIKAEASGYPDWVQTEEDRDAYIEDFYKAHKIRLTKDNIHPNPALRSLAKLCLNR